MDKQWMKDPLRCAMEARLSGKKRLVLGAVLVFAFLLAAMKLCAAMEGAAVIALTGACCAAMLTWGAWRKLNDQPVMVLLCAALLTMLAVAAHLAMLGIRPGRVSKVLEPMLADMWNYDLLTAMAWEDKAWSGGYLVVMALVSRLENFPQVVALKLFDMVCQMLAALAVLNLAAKRGAKPGAAVMGMFACVLAPTMLLNAGCWAQCDAMFAALTLWGLYLLMDDHPVWGSVLWGMAAATKLQSVFIFPLLLVFFAKRKISARHILALLAAFIAFQAAFLLDGQGLEAVFGRYAMQIDEAAYGDVGLSDHAVGVFGLMNIASVREFSGMGMYLGFACAVMVVFAMLHAHRELDADAVLLGALLLAAGLPLILPQVNARCLYLAGMLAFAAAGNARRMAAALTLELVSLCSYMEAIFSFTILPMQALSLIAIAVAVVIALELLRKLKPGEKEALCHEGGA